MAVTHDFRSDNTAGAAPEILDALARASSGGTPSYGADPWTARVQERIAALEAEIARSRVAIDGKSSQRSAADALFNFR